MGKLQFIPSPAISGFYEVVNTHYPNLINTKIGDVDLSTISIEDAHKLYEAGTDYLKKLSPKKITANPKKAD